MIDINNNPITLAIFHQHDVVCNQKYNKDLPYSFHLKAVYNMSVKYSYLISKDKHDICNYAAIGHDLIEDARMTYNDVKMLILNKEVADIIYACTEEKGKNRSERHSDKFFSELAENRLAVYVKLCDIMANVLFSIMTNSSMLGKYRSEFPNLKEKLYVCQEYDILWDKLENLLNPY